MPGGLTVKKLVAAAQILDVDNLTGFFNAKKQRLHIASHFVMLRARNRPFD
jgi:hypothetical protein